MRLGYQYNIFGEIVYFDANETYLSLMGKVRY